MLLKEAKEILKKNGYRIDEAALTMRSVNKTLNKLFGIEYNVVADESPRKCYVQYYDFETGIYETGELKVDRLSDLTLEEWIEETKKVAEKVKKSKIRRIGEAYLKNNGFIVEAANDYDVETLVKMWIEQNKPAGDNIDFREHDDGSISIFDIIYDPHDCGDDWDQEWDFLADFKNIDELKAAVGV